MVIFICMFLQNIQDKHINHFLIEGHIIYTSSLCTLFCISLLILYQCMKKLSFTYLTIEELVKLAEEELSNTTYYTEEEMEDDAEGGYFEDD